MSVEWAADDGPPLGRSGTFSDETMAQLVADVYGVDASAVQVVSSSWDPRRRLTINAVIAPSEQEVYITFTETGPPPVLITMPPDEDDPVDPQFVAYPPDVGVLKRGFNSALL